jgi:hypothetical protein
MRARITLADVTLGNKRVIEIAGRSGSGFQLAHRAAPLCPVEAADAQADLPTPPGSHAERQIRTSALPAGCGCPGRERATVGGCRHRVSALGGVCAGGVEHYASEPCLPVVG